MPSFPPPSVRAARALGAFACLVASLCVCAAGGAWAQVSAPDTAAQPQPVPTYTYPDGWLVLTGPVSDAALQRLLGDLTSDDDGARRFAVRALTAYLCEQRMVDRGVLGDFQRAYLPYAALLAQRQDAVLFGDAPKAPVIEETRAARGLEWMIVYRMGSRARRRELLEEALHDEWPRLIGNHALVLSQFEELLDPEEAIAMLETFRAQTELPPPDAEQVADTIAHLQLLRDVDAAPDDTARLRLMRDALLGEPAGSVAGRACLVLRELVDWPTGGADGVLARVAADEDVGMALRAAARDALALRRPD